MQREMERETEKDGERERQAAGTWGEHEPFPPGGNGAAGGGGPLAAEGAGPAAGPELSRPQQCTIPGILHYIQHEWARFEMERAHWEVERAALQGCYRAQWLAADL